MPQSTGRGPPLPYSIAMMDTLKAFGLAGFLFFLIKGLMWLVLFALVARGVVPREKVERWRRAFRWPRKDRD